MSELPQGHECLSEHPTEFGAREAAHDALRNLPRGWALYLAGDPESGYKVIQYALNLVPPPPR